MDKTSKQNIKGLNPMKENLKLKFLTAVFLASVYSLTGCGGSGSSGGSEPQPEPQTPEVQISAFGDIYTGERYTLLVSEDVIEITANHGQVERANNGAVASTDSTASQRLVVKADNNVTWYYTPELTYFKNINDMEDFKEEFTLTYSDGTESKTSISLVKKEEGYVYDPLMQDQWHLINKGQNPFETAISPKEGVDLNVMDAWYQTDAKGEQISGKNVIVGVLDAPVDFEHEDLKENLTDLDITDLQKDKCLNTGLPLGEILKDESEMHGTAVTGIISASKNNVGVRGVAYNSKFASFTENSSCEEFNYDAFKQRKVNIVNASIGIDLSTDFNPSLSTSLDLMAKNGVPFIKAQGNEFRDNKNTDEDKPYSNDDCEGKEGSPVNVAVDCEFKQTSSLDRHVYNINVAAVNAEGVKSSYSSTGTNLWVSGFGGEFGYINGKTDSPAIISTLSHYTLDQLGKSDWDNGAPWRENRHDLGSDYYTQRMNGTSSATPTVTGVSSLVIHAKPDVTVPQLRYILAKTARDNLKMSTLNYDEVKATHVPTGKQITVEKGWAENNAGFNFSNYYGFGLVDAGEAVKLALDCENQPDCKMYDDLPVEYVSVANNCVAEEGTDSKVVNCTFSTFKDEDGKNLTGSLMIDALSVDLRRLQYQNSITCPGIYDSDEAIAEESKYDANHDLHIEMVSPGKTVATVKPYLSNWDYIYDGMEDPEDGDDEDLLLKNIISGDESLYISTNNFYREKFNNDGQFTMKIYSGCPLNVNSFTSEGSGEKIHLRVYGYQQQ